jgi:hypothetical protein
MASRPSVLDDEEYVDKMMPDEIEEAIMTGKQL